MRSRIRRELQFLTVFCSLLIIFVSFVYANQITRAIKIYSPVSFRFLLSNEKTFAASINTADCNGGAVYVMQQGGKAEVVYDCYFNGEKAISVQNRLRKKGVQTKIYEKEIQTLYLKEKTEKKNKAKILGILQTVEDCIFVLDELIEKAETGDFSQDRLRDSLQVVQKVLFGVSKNKTYPFSEIAKICMDCEKELARMRSEIIFAKELRFVKVALCDGYIRFCENFSL